MIKLYNTLTRKKEPFKPLRKNKAAMYTCGPTVYNYAHIGNLRTYVFEDILRRTLEYAGFKVTHVMNITDVEDKIIRDAKKEGKNIFEFVKPYEKAFFEDLAALNIKRAQKYPKATAHVKEMIGLISSLLKKGIAYKTDGSVYFAISKFPNYGKLSRIRKQDLKTGSRADADEYTKQNAEDFVLWKGKKEGEPSWPAPFGEGRPGWHIECSAMSMKYLGHTFDIHGGGVDLIFPHHENEIAQSEAATGKPFARVFMEGEHLLVNGEKMSKSLGNIFTLRDFEKKEINPLAFRYLVLTAHYRSKLNFTWESLAAAQNSLERLREFARNLNAAKKKTNYGARIAKRDLKKYESKFENAVFDDLDTPKAVAVLRSLVREYNKNPEKFDPKETVTALHQFDAILGLGLKEEKEEKIPRYILALAKRRENLRQEKKWEEADKLREEMERSGYEIKDTAEGARIQRSDIQNQNAAQNAKGAGTF